MQTVTQADQLFRGLQHLREKSREPSGIDPMIGNAVIATCARALEAYLQKKYSFEFTYSIGDVSLRSYSVMEMIRDELEDLFGTRNVRVHRDDDFHLGILIRVSF